MRDILFRGKRLDNGEWAYGFLVKHPSAVGFTDDSPWYISVSPEDPDDTGGCYNVDLDTVGQYTGLKDKNGKRIFEGDIVADEVAHKHAVVRFRAPAFWLEYPGHEDLNECEWADCANQLTVIGNIHDNPELLSGGVENA